MRVLLRARARPTVPVASARNVDARGTGGRAATAVPATHAGAPGSLLAA